MHTVENLGKGGSSNSAKIPGGWGSFKNSRGTPFVFYNIAFFTNKFFQRIFESLTREDMADQFMSI